jgi:hypothetical protein
LQGATQAIEDHQETLKRTMLRSLQQAAEGTGSEKVVYVATANEFQAAARAGARHIEVTEHLDLTNDEAFYKVHVSRSTWSIRVRPTCVLLAMAIDDNKESACVSCLRGTLVTSGAGPSASSPALRFCLNHSIH